MSRFRNLMRGSVLTLALAGGAFAVSGLLATSRAEPSPPVKITTEGPGAGAQDSGPEETLGTPWVETAAVGAGGPSKDAGQGRRFGSIGQPASEALVKAWDIDIRPDGKGLPPGKGTALQGEEIYAMQCAHCHGDFGYGISGYPALVGGETDRLHVQPVQGGPEKTVGSYWPYASTLWDYIHRAMPFGNAQSLSADETYALTAYILNMNGIIEDDHELNQDTLAKVKMPNADGFYIDPRPDVIGSLCMENCTDKAPEITSSAKAVAVTPEGEEAVR